MDSEKFQELVLEQLKVIDNRLGNVEQGQEALAGRMDRLEQGQEALEQGQKALAGRMDRLEGRMDRLELRLENEVIEKLRGLYDFRDAQNDANTRILAALERIEAKIESHDVQIHILDQTKANKRKAK